MKNLHQSKSSGLSPLREGLDELDLSAKEELDGVESDLDQDLENDLDPIEADLDTMERPERPESSGSQEYSVNHVVSQLDGMVDHWFKLAQNVQPEQKENFLKLGERLSEIVAVLQSEFSNG